MEDRWELSAEQSPGFGPIAERFRRAGELDRAVALCREGLAKFPNHLSGRVTLGWALLDLGRYDEARVELERVLKRAPDNLAAIRGLAELHDRADHVEFAPTETPIASWPPKPDPAEAVVVGEAPAPTVSSTWRDPEAFATAPASAVSTTEKPESGVEIAPDELPALLAELDPLLTTSETAAESIEAAPSVALQSSVSEVVADAPALESLEAAMAELAASGAHAEAETGALVAELAVSDTAELDKALSDLTRVDQPATPVEAVITAAAVSDVAPAASTEALVEQLQSSNDAVEVMPDVFPVLDENPLPEPAMDVLAELAEIEDEHCWRQQQPPTDV
jgi:tetratricopeptide (TPR) repeat protein